MIAQQPSFQGRITDVDYIDSIEDPFFKLVAQQVRGGATDGAQEEDDNKKDVSAKYRLEDMEISIRKRLLELLLSLQEGENADGSRAADVIGVFWKSCLDLCHHFVHHACSSSSSETSYENLMPCRRLPYVLLSDCLEGLPTLEDAKAFWSDYVEPELETTVLFGDKFWSQLTESNNSKKFSLPSSHLPFLKVANQFLTRLEHSSENMVRVEWKGRIMWALSKGFSITDKSSMKLWGNFHTTNETDFESKEEFSKHTTVAGVASSTNVIEYNLYEAFWSLQSDFSNPNKINVGDFIKRLRLILAAMESATATSSTAVIPDDESGGIQPTTKYLTSSVLLPSQIQDPAFRSSVATQFLIVASHLGAESPPLKNALGSLLGRARKLLKNDNPQLHAILWESILASGREDHWRTWKKQKCAASAFAPNKRNQQLVLDSIADYDREEKRRRTEEENSSSQEGIVSSLSANFLNNNDLIAVSKDSHQKIPTLEEHLELYVEALDPESGIEDEYHPKNDSLFTWRAMRLYAKHQLPLMSQCRRPADLEKITRKWYKESTGTNIPGEMPVDEPDNTDDNIANDEMDPTNDAGDGQNDSNGNDDTNMDVDTQGENESTNNDTVMKNDEIQEEADKQVKLENNDEAIAISKEPEGKVETEVENIKKLDGDQQKADGIDTTKIKIDDTEAENARNENAGPKKGSPERTVSSTDGKGRKSKTDKADEEKPKPKNNQGPKANTATSNGKNNQDKNSDKNRNNRNNSQRQEKRPPPRENNPPPNRGGGRRGNDGGRGMQDRGRRDDGPPPRRGRGDDNRGGGGGGRSGGDSSYRGRSDGPPPRGGGRYDEDYRGDRHGDYRGGDRFSGDRPNRSGGRDNNRGSEKGGGTGRDDNRGGRPRDGGGGRRRR
mmetsp:Transcript_9426/g.23485  ORF Transcript_9426/g.23485 Transcript_9426/m.23485 type:complete len:896 (-) Transcript_9426:305-2992(-)